MGHVACGRLLDDIVLRSEHQCLFQKSQHDEWTTPGLSNTGRSVKAFITACLLIFCGTQCTIRLRQTDALEANDPHM